MVSCARLLLSLLVADAPDESDAAFAVSDVIAILAAFAADDEIVRTRFRKQDGQGYANWDDYLGLEHAQVQGGRKKAAIKSHYDKPIKING